MEHKGYNIEEIHNGVAVENVKDFNPVHVFECGQCFRWLKQKDNSYTGVAKGKVINVNMHKDKLIILNTNLEDFVDIWFDYFDLGRDYSEIMDKLSSDKIMKEAIKFGYGIRVLKQDIWETLISFIISANNRIPMIMKVVASLSEKYGDEIIFDKNKYYTFPTLERLANCTVDELSTCKMGFRSKYIMKTSIALKNGEVRIDNLNSINTFDARNELTKLPGVGNKVADCTLLYSGTKSDVFPTDVWVKRVMEELYFKRAASLVEIQEFAHTNFGDIAGIAQQYLFYYAKENKIGYP